MSNLLIYIILHPSPFPNVDIYPWLIYLVPL